jgi:hypothetical protein
VTSSFFFKSPISICTRRLRNRAFGAALSHLLYDSIACSRIALNGYVSAEQDDVRIPKYILVEYTATHSEFFVSLPNGGKLIGPHVQAPILWTCFGPRIRVADLLGGSGPQERE